MEKQFNQGEQFDVIIIGGSYAGLSAAMTLGRSLRKVLVIDSGNPCNASTPHSHNFLTQDGKAPQEISEIAKSQVEKYNTVKFYLGQAVKGGKTTTGFLIETSEGDVIEAKKLIFATGITDQMPAIDGLRECWGVSVIHCPYCHGYEVRGQKTGVIGNGDSGFDYLRMIANWTKDLTLFTNGKSALSEGQLAKLEYHNIQLVEKEIVQIEHDNRLIQNVAFADGYKQQLSALYYRASFQQHCTIPESLGCELTEQGFYKVDAFQRTTVPGIYACGDNSSPMRSVANAVGSGNMAAAMLNRDMVENDFQEAFFS